MPLPEKCRNLLTICRKAGKLEAGFARAKDAIQGGYAACILLTADLSEKSRKEVLYFAEKQHVPVVQTDWEMAEVRLLFGQRAGILTVKPDSPSGFRLYYRPNRPPAMDDAYHSF